MPYKKWEHYNTTRSVMFVEYDKDEFKDCIQLVYKYYPYLEGCVV